MKEGLEKNILNLENKNKEVNKDNKELNIENEDI